MPKLRVVEGKLSSKYNHFKDYRFDSCIATDTRLMGVVAMKVSWTAKDGSRDKLFQLIHLDFSEYGVDDYREIFSNANNPEVVVKLGQNGNVYQVVLEAAKLKSHSLHLCS